MMGRATRGRLEARGSGRAGRRHARLLCAPEPERAPLRVSADRPARAGMDDRAAELDDAGERRLEVAHGEVGQRDAVAGPRPAWVKAEFGPCRVRLQPAALPLPPIVEGDAEQPL